MQSKLDKVKLVRQIDGKMGTMLITAYANEEEKEVVGTLNAIPAIGLVSLEVIESHRRRGIGTRLLTEYEQLLRTRTGIKKIAFICAIDNAPALALYKKLGYTIHDDIREDDEDGQEYFDCTKMLR